VVVGLEFLPGQDRARAQLALGLFATRLAPADAPLPVVGAVGSAPLGEAAA
jgi:hypothetical protein